MCVRACVRMLRNPSLFSLCNFIDASNSVGGPELHSQCSDFLQTERFGVRNLVEARFSAPSRAALGPTQPPIQYIPYLARGWSGWGIALTNNPHLALTLTLWNPSLSEARSLPTCCAFHAQVLLVPIYLHMYYNVDDLNFGLGCMEAFNEQACIWYCHLGMFCCTIWGRGGDKEPSTISCYSHMVCSLCCRCVVLRILLEKQKEKRLWWWCPDCKMPLCMPPCFKLYHTVVKFFICFYRNNVFIFIFILKYDSLSLRIW